MKIVYIAVLDFDEHRLIKYKAELPDSTNDSVDQLLMDNGHRLYQCNYMTFEEPIVDIDEDLTNENLNP